MQEKPKVSIIVPIYKVPQRFLCQCIESCINQTLKEIEIILVDDGSPDDCGNICDKYACKDTRVKVIHKENGGVSSARNIGIKNAIGEWIMFLDSDDWFEVNAVEIALQFVCKYNSDLIGFNHYYNSEKQEWLRKHISPYIIERKGRELKWFVLDMMFPFYDSCINSVETGAIRSVWGKLYRRNIISDNEMKFVEGLKISEDALFNIDYISYSKSVVLVDEYLMHYRVHSKSIMQRYNEDVLAINEYALDNYYLRIKNNWDDLDFQVAFLGMAAECVFRSMKMKFLHKDCPDNFPKKIKQFKESLKSEIYQKALQTSGYSHLPMGKKQIMYCIKYKFYLGAFLISWLSIKYLNRK